MANWSGEILALFSEKSEGMSLLMAKINSTLPTLSLEINEQVVNRFVYLCEGLSGLNKGDKVIVAREGHNFYILSKVKI